MLFAVGAAVIGKWSHGQPTASVKTVVETIFAVLVVSFLDQGESEPVAKGFAWLFLAAVLLSNNSPITGLTKVTSGTTTASTAVAVPLAQTAATNPTRTV